MISGKCEKKFQEGARTPLCARGSGVFYKGDKAPGNSKSSKHINALKKCQEQAFFPECLHPVGFVCAGKRYDGNINHMEPGSRG